MILPLAAGAATAAAAVRSNWDRAVHFASAPKDGVLSTSVSFYIDTDARPEDLKSVQGSLAAFIACFVLSLLYFSVINLMRERMFIVCLLGGLIGAFSELLPVGKLDYNFVFPVVSATLLTGLFYLFGGLS